MNERIRQLAVQALKHPDNDNDGLTVFDNDELKKFAELIVQECMDITKQCSTGKGIHDLFADEIIAEHFGVKE
jgi:hypothetical protein